MINQNYINHYVPCGFGSIETVKRRAFVDHLLTNKLRSKDNALCRSLFCNIFFHILLHPTMLKFHSFRLGSLCTVTPTKTIFYK